MANLIRNRHGSRFSQVKMIEGGSLSTSKAGSNIRCDEIFALSIRWNGKDGNGFTESFEIEMTKAEAEAELKSFAMMLGYQVTKQ